MSFIKNLAIDAITITGCGLYLIASGCALNTPDNGQNTLEPQGPVIVDEQGPTENCGPDDLPQDIDKLVAIPPNNAFGLKLGANYYYPGSERMSIRTYGLGQFEADNARMGAAFADFWSEGTKSYNTWAAAEANVHITIDDTVWPACDANYTGGSDECWFAGTTCAGYRNTNVTGTRVCEVWKIRLNVESMYLFADSRAIPREHILQAVAAHETGHTMGLRHRNGTVMSPGVPIPGYNGRTWETMPRFDACQTETLLDYVVDDSSEVIYLPNPEECE